MLASTLSRPRCGMPMTTSSSPCSAAWSIAASIIGMTVSAPSSENRFCPTYLVCRKVSNASAAFSLLKMYFCWATVGFSCLTSTRSSQPLLLFGLQDVGVLHADVPAVRITEQAEHVAQLLVLGAGEAVDLENPVQVPQRQPVGVHIEVGVAAEPALVQPQRVDVGHQVPAVAVGRDQLDDAGVLVFDRVRVVGAPPHRLVRDAQLAEDLVEEFVGEQQLVHGAQEVTGLGALDDAVVVGGGEGDQLADAQVGDAFLARALELRGVLHRADADDRALAAHQPGHRMHGADGAGVGQRDRHAGEVLGGQLAVAGAPHDVLVGGDELAEPHRLGTLDACDHQLTRAVLALQVDRQAQVGVGGGDGVRLSVDLGVVPVHVRELLDRLHDRVAQQVGERDLAAAGALEVVVDDDAVVDHQLGRDGAHAGRGRHVQRRRHVLHHGGGGAAQDLGLVAVGGGSGFRGRLRFGGFGFGGGDVCLGGRWLGLGGWCFSLGGSASAGADSVLTVAAPLPPAGLAAGAGPGSRGAVGADGCPSPALLDVPAVGSGE